MKLIAICGPTASGKTSLAVACARALGGEVVSCDALLVYKGLNIGTAKPTKEEMGGVIHHLIDIVEPTQNFSVHDFESAALPVVEDILARGKVPVLCGGTGFYMNAILFCSGFGHAGVDAAIREKYEHIAAERGREHLHSLLRECDPESAEKLHPNDVKRVIRALEIYALTGCRKSSQNDSFEPRYPYEAFAVNWERQTLYARIHERTQAMLQAGLVEEVKALLASGVSENAQCMQAIGYKEVIEILKNGDLHSTMSDIIEQNTRRYAKRQLTFFKKLPNLHWLEPDKTETMIKEIERYL